VLDAPVPDHDDLAGRGVQMILCAFGVRATDIEGAVDEARAEIRQQTRSQLTRQQRVLLEIIEEAGEIAAGELHERYEDEVSDPRTRRQRRDYLTKLERYNLIESAGATRWKTYRVVKAPVRS
jgi:Cdc6-like AAA superfamily ATPase